KAHPREWRVPANGLNCQRRSRENAEGDDGLVTDTHRAWSSLLALSRGSGPACSSAPVLAEVRNSNAAQGRLPFRVTIPSHRQARLSPDRRRGAASLTG